MTLDLETRQTLFGFVKGEDGLTPIAPSFYLCPECEEGDVTHYGGGLYICGKCDFQCHG